MCVICRGDSPGAGGDRQYITEFVCEPDAAADTTYSNIKAQTARSVLNLVVVAAAASCRNPSGVTSHLLRLHVLCWQHFLARACMCSNMTLILLLLPL
jgi:hypothetical protein